MAFKVGLNLLKIKRKELYDDCSPKLIKNKDIVSEVQKYYSNKKIRTKNTKINRGLIAKYKTSFIPSIKEIVINILLLNLFIGFFSNSSDTKVDPSYITLKINGPGDKNIFSNSYVLEFLPPCTQPNEVYINEVKQESVLNHYKFNETNNIVILVWDTIVTNCNCLFYKCKDIKEIDLSHFDTSQTLWMGGMFYECTGLNFINLSNLNTSNVIDMNSMFYNCLSLKSLDLSSFDTSKVINIRLMFYNCNSLNKLDISNFDTSEVKNMNAMFYQCSTLNSINILNFNTSKVEDMSFMFYDCNSLNSLDISNFNTINVKNKVGMFYNCT